MPNTHSEETGVRMGAQGQQLSSLLRFLGGPHPTKLARTVPVSTLWAFPPHAKLCCVPQEGRNLVCLIYTVPPVLAKHRVCAFDGWMDRWKMDA